jgi:hypothetical protein
VFQAGVDPIRVQNQTNPSLSTFTRWGTKDAVDALPKGDAGSDAAMDDTNCMNCRRQSTRAPSSRL